VHQFINCGLDRRDMRDREPAGASHQHQGPPIPIPFRGISRLCSQEKFPLGFRRREFGAGNSRHGPAIAPRGDLSAGSENGGFEKPS